MKKAEVKQNLLKKIEKATLQNSGYKIPESYNNIWRKKAEELIAKKVVRSDKKGLWLVKK